MTLNEFIGHVWKMLIGREHGPLHFRFVLQPMVAVALALRFGIADALAGRPPFFFWAIFTDSGRRSELLRSAWQQVGKLFVAAVGLDILYQVIVYRWIYPTQTLIVAVVLAFLPYLLIRGPAARVARLILKTRKHRNEAKS